MFRHLYVLALLLSSSLCSAQSSAQSQATQAPSSPAGISNSGERSESRINTQSAKSPGAAQTRLAPTSDFAASVQSWRDERAQAKVTGAQSKEAEAAFNEARTLELWSTVDSKQADRASEAVDAYRVAISSGSVSQRSLAANNLGVLLLRLGRADDALQAFQQLDLKAVAPGDVYLYQYNYGRALELSGTKKEAYAHYSESAALQPDFGPAIEGAYRTLWQTKPLPIADGAKLALLAIKGGRAELAHAQSRRFLIEWNNDPEASELLAALLHSYVALATDPQSFQKEEWPWLQKLQSSSLEPGIKELNVAYSGKFPYELVHYAGQFPYWSRQNDREVFGELLKSIGDDYATAGSYQEALACYSNSWVIAREPEAALYTAALLRDHRSLDPGGELVNQLIQSLFEQKGNAYMKQDWPNILRLHTVLGTIFEGQSRWGSSGDPFSATFQWEHALSAQSQVIKVDRDFPPSPGLNLHLANCYRRLNRTSEAQAQYLSAAEAFLKVSDSEQAASAMRELHSLGGSGAMPPDEANRVKTVEDILAHIGKG